MRKYFLAAALAAFLLSSPEAQAFCGFYVAKADAKLFNKASKVVIAHDGDKNVVTMSSDFQGDPKEFAVVIPVPTVITKEQVHITENALVDHVDAYTAPRLVEYWDSDPCQKVEFESDIASKKKVPMPVPILARARSLGVTIEAQYTVGEYDILILSAKESGGLEVWLKESGYKIPDGAAPVLGSYIKQNMKFFVAKVNLKEQQKMGFEFLRPIQVAYESPKFMLPIRLGTVNANGPQELFIYTLTQKGRVETTNYRTVKIPSGNDVPLFTKGKFGDFYKAMFDTQVKKEDMRTVFLEYAWNMGMCDPCSADPIPNDKLVELGAFWLVPQLSPSAGSLPYAPPPPPQMKSSTFLPPPPPPPPPPPFGRPYWGSNGSTFITRLHVRYDREHFPEDLMFEETSNQENFQGRYVLHHPWTGEASCPAGAEYKRTLPDRYSREAESLAGLTGWDMKDIRSQMEEHGQSFDPAKATQPLKWYQQLWNSPKSE